MTGLAAREVFSRLAEKWQTHRSTRAALAELDGMDPSVVGEIAREAGLDVADLREVVSKGADADKLMYRMMDAFGIDADKLAREAPAFLKEVSIACSKCDDKGRCRRELAAGTAREHAAEFCPNEASFVAIS